MIIICARESIGNANLSIYEFRKFPPQLKPAMNIPGGIIPIQPCITTYTPSSSTKNMRYSHHHTLYFPCLGACVDRLFELIAPAW